MKANTAEVSIIVIISLITSFWSLAGRVASDDKQMFQEDWKKINFRCSIKMKGINDVVCCPCINHRWVVRVVLWRFLEISSRITLLCLVWINLGGLSIFIILGLEMSYLAIICFGLGTYVLLLQVLVLFY